MDDRAFEDLLQGVRQLGRHRRGEPVAGVRVTEVAEVVPKAIREATNLSQAEFAKLVGVPVKTLQNWEQRRTRPAGAARALLRALANDPRAVMKALNA